MDRNGTPAVAAVGLVKRFGDVIALDGVDLRVVAGEVHGLLGPNGAGKSTLLRLLLGLVRPDEGSLRVLGSGAGATSTTGMAGLAGFVDAPRSYPYLSGRRNLELLAALDGERRRDAQDLVAAALDTVGLTGRETEKVRGYSSGMRQRLGLAAALLRQPRLLVLDEPTNGLDPAGTRDLGLLLRRLAAGGVAVLLSSHNMAEVDEHCDSVTVLRAGSVAWSGRLEQLRAEAPAPVYRLRTSDDSAATRVATACPGVVLTPAAAGLTVAAGPDPLDGYVLALGRAGVAVRRLELQSGPLASMFFRLTEEPAGEPDDAVLGTRVPAGTAA